MLHVANIKSSRLVAWKVEKLCRERSIDMDKMKNEVSAEFTKPPKLMS